MKTFERISHMWGSWFKFSEVGLDLKRLAHSVLNTNTSAPKQLHFLLSPPCLFKIAQLFNVLSLQIIALIFCLIRYPSVRLWRSREPCDYQFTTVGNG